MRALRSHRLAVSAAAAFGLTGARCRLLHDGYNATYRVDTSDGTRLALRLSRPGPTPADVRAEVAWTTALARDTDIGVSAPPARFAADPVRVVEGRVAVLTRWVHGAERYRGLTPRMLRAVGATMARLHEHGAAWSPPRGWTRARLDHTWLDGPSPIPQLPADAAPAFAEAERVLKPVLGALFDAGTHVLHADLHQHNYRFAPGHRVGVLDFDDTSVGHPAQDVAISSYYLLRHPRFEDLLSALEAGYRSVRAWPTDRATLEALWVWRTLGLCASVHHHPSAELRSVLPELLPRWTERVRTWLERS